MNAREMYDTIQRDDPLGRHQVLFQLLLLTQTLSTAVLELAGSTKLKTGHDPLRSRTRLLLSEFIELPREET
jgi:hypothetical protein